jgi:hypothetical protein
MKNIFSSALGYLLMEVPLIPVVIVWAVDMMLQVTIVLQLLCLPLP